MATLVTLLDAASNAHLRTVLQELARDEVQHARLGWAYLAWAKDRLDLSFLSAFLPAMATAATGEDLFQPGPPEADDPRSSARASCPSATVAGSIWRRSTRW
jgi:hypothetical protein